MQRLPRTQSWPRSAYPAPRPRHHHDPGHSTLRRAPYRGPLSQDLYSDPRQVYSHTPSYQGSIHPPASNFSDVDEGEPYESDNVEDYENGHNHAPDHEHHDVDGFESDASETAYTHTPCPCHACGSSSPPHAQSYTRSDPCFAVAPLPPYHSHEPDPKPTPMTLTSLLLRFVHAYVLPYLPADLAEVVRNPPDLTQPQTLVPLIRAIAPYTQYLLVLLFFYIIWAFVAGFIGYTVRFMRFCFKIGPVIALIAWIMAASGQGGIDVIFEALKQYAGLGDPAAPPARAAGGRATRANPNGYAYGAGNKRRRAAAGSGGGWRKPAPPADQPDILSAIFGNPATGDAGMGAQVQSFVKGAVARGLGLDWLVAPPKEEKKSKSR